MVFITEFNFLNIRNFPHNEWRWFSIAPPLPPLCMTSTAPVQAIGPIQLINEAWIHNPIV